MKLSKFAAIATAGLFLLLALPAGGAGAHAGGSAETEFIDTGVSCSPELPGDKCLYSGLIDSESKKCIQGRKVKMFALLEPQPGEIVNKLVDTGTTSKKGAFAGFGRPSDVSAAKFKVTKTTVGDVTCKGASFTGA